MNDAMGWLDGQGVDGGICSMGVKESGAGEGMITHAEAEITM